MSSLAAKTCVPCRGGVPPLMRIMWYSNVVPDRPQPSTKTGALLLSAFSPTVSGALFSVSCMSGP